VGRVRSWKGASHSFVGEKVGYYDR